MKKSTGFWTIGVLASIALGCIMLEKILFRNKSRSSNLAGATSSAAPTLKKTKTTNEEIKEHLEVLEFMMDTLLNKVKRMEKQMGTQKVSSPAKEHHFYETKGRGMFTEPEEGFISGNMPEAPPKELKLYKLHPSKNHNDKRKEKATLPDHEGSNTLSLPTDNFSIDRSEKEPGFHYPPSQPLEPFIKSLLDGPEPISYPTIHLPGSNLGLQPMAFASIPFAPSHISNHAKHPQDDESDLKNQMFRTISFDSYEDLKNYNDDLERGRTPTGKGILKTNIIGGSDAEPNTGHTQKGDQASETERMLLENLFSNPQKKQFSGDFDESEKRQPGFNEKTDNLLDGLFDDIAEKVHSQNELSELAKRGVRDELPLTGSFLAGANKKTEEKPATSIEPNLLVKDEEPSGRASDKSDSSKLDEPNKTLLATIQNLESRIKTLEEQKPKDAGKGQPDNLVGLNESFSKLELPKSVSLNTTGESSKIANALLSGDNASKATEGSIVKPSSLDSTVSKKLSDTDLDNSTNN